MRSTPRPVALVTGGSRGIGAAVVEKFAREGYDVAFCYRSRPDAAAEVVERARSVGAEVVAERVDVADPRAVKDFVLAAEAALGPPTAVVTSAGVIQDGPLVTMPDQAWHSVVDTNLTGAFHVCRAAVFTMLKRRRGSIVTISSVAGVHGQAGQTNYSASKAGIIGFTKALAKEVGRYGIRANAVAPGFIATDMTAGLGGQAGEELSRQIALGRWGEAREVADLVEFLASDRASYITGAVLPVDGGIRL